MFQVEFEKKKFLQTSNKNLEINFGLINGLQLAKHFTGDILHNVKEIREAEKKFLL